MSSTPAFSGFLGIDPGVCMLEWDPERSFSHREMTLVDVGEIDELLGVL
jgi:hypothetical protein